MLNVRSVGVMIGSVTVYICGMLPCAAKDGFLTIREIQYTDSPDGASPYNGRVVDCAGGIVVIKVERGRPRLFLQDPNVLDGWGAIQVKGWSSDAFASVAVGDWIELEQMLRRIRRGESGVATYRSAWWTEDQPRIVRKLAAFVPLQLGHRHWSVGASMSYAEIAGPIKAHALSMVVATVLAAVALLGGAVVAFRAIRRNT